MGSPFQIVCEETDNITPKRIYFYSHWGGYEPEAAEQVASCLETAKSRWNDFPYACRIIFCTLAGDDINGTTGYGIDTEHMDESIPSFILNFTNQTVYRGNRGVGDPVISFKEFIKNPEILIQ